MTDVADRAGAASSRRSPIGHLLGRGMAYAIATAIQGAVGVLALPAITRSVADPDQYGVIATALVVVQLAGVFATLGLPAALTREYYDAKVGHDRAAHLVGSTVVGAVAVAALIHLTGPWWTHAFASLQYERALQLAVATIVPTAALVAGQALLRCRDNATLYVAATVVGTAGAQLLGLVLLWTGPDTAERFLLGYLAGVALGALVALGGVGLRFVRPAATAVTVSALRLGLPTLPHAVALFLVVAADRVVVERYEGLAEAGRYQFTYLLGMVGVSLLLAINNAWVPLVYEVAEDAERWSVLAATTEALVRLSVPIVAGLAIGAPVILGIAAPADYQPASLASVLAVASLSLVPYVLYLAAAMVVFHQRRSGWLAVISPVVAAANFAANIVAVPRFGLIGAALVSLLSYGLLAGLTVAAAHRVVPVPWPVAALAKHALVAVGAVALALSLPTGGVWLAMRFVASLVCLATLVVHGRRLSKTPTPVWTAA